MYRKYLFIIISLKKVFISWQIPFLISIFTWRSGQYWWGPPPSAIRLPCSTLTCIQESSGRDLCVYRREGWNMKENSDISLANILYSIFSSSTRLTIKCSIFEVLILWRLELSNPHPVKSLNTPLLQRDWTHRIPSSGCRIKSIYITFFVVAFYGPMIYTL